MTLKPATTHAAPANQAHWPLKSVRFHVPARPRPRNRLEPLEVREPTRHPAVTVAGRASSLGRAQASSLTPVSPPNAATRSSS